MDMLNMAARQLLLFAHLICFALSFAAILREDMALLTTQHIDGGRLAAAGRAITWMLGVLWVTGMGLLLLEFGWDLTALASRPKLLAKLAVVSVLTLNGALLHRLALPALAGPVHSPQRAATLCAVLGAVSSVSWLLASFVGASRLIAPWMSLGGFLVLYFAGLAVGLLIALVLVRPRIERMLLRQFHAGAQQAFAG